ncbi:hypothetical protein ACOME3_001651 [Neoechinorhynchus agilis]
MNSRVVPQLSEKEKLQQAKRIALSTGLIQAREPERGFSIAQYLPFCLNRGKVPLAVYQQASQLEPLFTNMYHRIANDHKFLNSVLKKSSAHDPYIERLLQIMNEVDELGTKPRARVELTRNDYMIDKIYQTFKQVEFNLVSVAYITLTDHMGQQTSNDFFYQVSYSMEKTFVIDCADRAAKALRDAIELYEHDNSKLVVIFVVIGNEEINISDHTNLAIRLHRRVFYLTLSQIARKCSVDNDYRLFLKDDDTGNNMEVALVYFRAGYVIKHFNTEDEWSAIKMIEASVCVKSTGIDRRLANTKRIQAELYRRPDLLRTYAGCDEETTRQLMSLFCEMYRLEVDDELEEAKKRVKDEPLQWVLKYNAEGGGNNIFGNDADYAVMEAERFWLSINEWITDSALGGDLDDCILQRLINPVVYKNMIVRAGETEQKYEDVIDEYGIFSALLIKTTEDGKDEVIYNHVIGNLVRTKSAASAEGGISAGFGAIGSLECLD